MIAPAPVVESEKKDSCSGMWDKLNDGHKPVDISTPSPTRAEPASAEKETEIPAAPVEEKAAAKESAVETKFAEASPEIPNAAEHAAPVAAEKSAEPVAPAPAATSLAGTYTPPKRVGEDVPVKWQPSHKAYGSKVKLKAKKLKEISGKHRTVVKEKDASKHAAKPAEHHGHDAKHHKSEAPHKPESKHKTAHAPEKSEGVLKRLIRKIFKK